jgi:membrane protease YdiL (CAAX protease family)
MDRYQGSFRNPAGPGPLGGLVVTLFALALATLLSQLTALATGGGSIRITAQGLEPGTFIVLALCSAAGFLSVSGLLILMFRGRIDLAVHRSDVGPAAAALAAILLANLAGTFLGGWLGENYAGAPDLRSGGPAVTGVFLVAVLLAPAVEELFFREVLLVRALAGTPRALSISVTAISFGLFHMTAGGIALVLTLTFMGVVLAWLRLRTGSLAAPFLVHALNNAVALLFLS